MKWQSIDTAPLDMEILLGTEPTEDFPNGFVSQGFWQTGWEDSVGDMGCNDGFVDCNYQVYCPPRRFGNPRYQTEGFQPTHWMPLPNPPEVSQ